MPLKSADTRVLIEVCVDSVAGARAADCGGADRLELCANLVEGGTTPSAGMIRTVLDATQLPIMVMIRPRGGDFCYDRDELNTMQHELEAVLEHPVAGVVLGALTPDGRIDMNVCQRLGQQAAGNTGLPNTAAEKSTGGRIKECPCAMVPWGAAPAVL